MIEGIYAVIHQGQREVGGKKERERERER